MHSHKQTDDSAIDDRADAIGVSRRGNWNR